MGTQITFTPLLGALTDGPVSYLLNVDGLKVVLDCGWTDAYDAESLQPVCEARTSFPAQLTHAIAVEPPSDFSWSTGCSTGRSCSIDPWGHGAPWSPALPGSPESPHCASLCHAACGQNGADGHV